MTRGAFLHEVRDSGCTQYHLKSLLLRGIIRTERDGAGNRLYTKKHAAQVREYMASPRKRGRPPVIREDAK